jgi:hypothetical protein
MAPILPIVLLGCTPRLVKTPVPVFTENVVMLRLMRLFTNRNVPAAFDTSPFAVVPPVANGEPGTAVNVVAAPLPEIW